MYKLTIEKAPNYATENSPSLSQAPTFPESLEFRTLETAKRYIAQTPLNEKFQYAITKDGKKIDFAKTNNDQTAPWESLHSRPRVRLPRTCLLEISDGEMFTRLPEDRETPAAVSILLDDASYAAPSPRSDAPSHESP